MAVGAALGGESGALFAALKDCERGAWAHSSLYRWMVDNHEAMSRAITGKKVRWEKLSEAAISDGLTTRDGQKPKGETLRKTWYRVRKAVATLREREAKKREESEAREASMKEERRAERVRQAESARTLAARIDGAERAATWRREKAASDAPYLREATAHLRARQIANGLLPGSESVPVEATAAVVPEREEGEPGLVTLDLPQFDAPYVSERAYRAFDPSLPPVKKGDICKATGIKWEIGDDLPGYPSKRHYEYEKDWLRDVGRLLRAKHPTNLTMTDDERYVMRTAKSRIPNLY
ncbi:hypothetical protein ACMAUO_20105 [Gluconacetobacter sp. Hr-1-5]|uniref:hypothetical protein n=1 Tax=Gluconacetobacter sp. Hr-1-5 TaxID=3395370 RepID=UPI003B515EE9